MPLREGLQNQKGRLGTKTSTPKLTQSTTTRGRLEVNLACLSNGELMAYRKTFTRYDSGATPCVLFVHGSLDTSLQMEPLMSAFQHQAQCVAIDLRGSGQSSYRSKVGAIADLAGDLRLFMREALPKVESYFIVGHGLGATIALELAELSSARILGLALIAPVVGKADPRVTFHDRYCNLDRCQLHNFQFRNGLS